MGWMKTLPRLFLQPPWLSMLCIYTLSKILAYKLCLYPNLLPNLFVVQYSWINNILSESKILLEAKHLSLRLYKIHNSSTEHKYVKQMPHRLKGKRFPTLLCYLKIRNWKSITVSGVQRISVVSSYLYAIPVLQNWKFLSTRDTTDF